MANKTHAGLLTFAVCCLSGFAFAAEFATTITLTASDKATTVSPNIYGQYLEHVEEHEDIIYPVIWNGDAPQSNSIGLRLDTIAAVRELQVPIVRWPGGCFADVYHWEDGIGPQSERPPKPNLHWGGTEPNHFGTDEFLQFCELAGIEPYINVNLGSGTLDEALRWLEYCNGTTATEQGHRRAENGRVEPYNVKFWGVGNETWGPWEMGHTDATTYSTSLSLWAKAMKKQDPTIRILGVGSEEGNDHKWDRTVLNRAGNDIDFLTIHMYGATMENSKEDYLRLAFTADYFDDRLKRVSRMIDEMTSNSVKISIDEWNIRHFENGKQNRKSPRAMQDAIFSAGFLNAMIRQADYVEMANYVFLINGNGTLLMRDGQVVWTPLAHVFHGYVQAMTGPLVATQVEGPGTVPPRLITAVAERYVPEDYKPGERPWIDTAAVKGSDGGYVVSVVNRNPDEIAKVSLVNPEGKQLRIKRAWQLAGDSVHAENDFDQPDAVKPREITSMEGGTYESPAGSVSILWCD